MGEKKGTLRREKETIIFKNMEILKLENTVSEI